VGKDTAEISHYQEAQNGFVSSQQQQEL